jgi:nitrogen fixation protein NifU and related proteins
MYSTQLLNHFEHPRYAGDLPGANVRVRVENPACGDILELAAKVENGTILEIRFLAKGCVPAMACGSAIALLTHGHQVVELASIGKEDVLREVAGVPPASGHAAQLAIDALSELMKAATGAATSAAGSRSAP